MEFGAAREARETPPPLVPGRDRDLENLESLIERLAAGGYERSLMTFGHSSSVVLRDVGSASSPARARHRELAGRNELRKADNLLLDAGQAAVTQRSRQLFAREDSHPG